MDPELVLSGAAPMLPAVLSLEQEQPTFCPFAAVPVSRGSEWDISQPAWGPPPLPLSLSGWAGCGELTFSLPQSISCR